MSSYWHDFLSNFSFKFFYMFLLIHIYATPLLPPPPQKKFFSRDYNGNKATQIFCVISFIAPRIFSFILHYRLAFDCKFIWKRYVTFSFIQFIFVIVKDKGIMGIFQGDSLSVMLFVLCLNPLSFLLNKWKGYSFGRDRKLQHTHNFFVDDLKLHSQDLSSTKKHSYIITTFSSDINMRFGEDKCAYLQIEKRKVM